jgi:hypothetical protein
MRTTLCDGFRSADVDLGPSRATHPALKDLFQRTKARGKAVALTNNDARIVLGMVARGDKEHDIAAWFGENQARVAEVKQGSHGSVTAAAASELPPKGAPGPKGQRLRGSVKNALKALEEKGADGVEEAIQHLKDGLARFNRNEA